MCTTFWTISGKEIDIDNFKPEDVSLNDISHSLSYMCRFNGHAKHFYSVAEHSILVSRILPIELRNEGLFHDASECFFGDIISPVKKLFTEIKSYEDNIMSVISKVFNLQFPENPLVKWADLTVLRYELEIFYPKMFERFYDDPTAWVHKYTNLDIGEMIYHHVECALNPEDAKEMFLKEFDKNCLQLEKMEYNKT